MHNQKPSAQNIQTHIILPYFTGLHSSLNTDWTEHVLVPEGIATELNQSRGSFMEAKQTRAERRHLADAGTDAGIDARVGRMGFWNVVTCRCGGGGASSMWAGAGRGAFRW